MGIENKKSKENDMTADMHDVARVNDGATTVTVMATDQKPNSKKNVAAVWQAAIYAGWGMAIVGATLWSAYVFWSEH